MQRFLNPGLLVTRLLVIVGFFGNGWGQTIGPVKRTVAGPLTCDLITEASGLAASRQNDHVLWTHNDSGDKNRIFALNTKGEHLGTFYIRGAKAIDWEDIAVGPGPLDEYDYLYIGDIGDNKKKRRIKTIYRVAEPIISADRPGKDSVLTHVEKISFTLPDGIRDTETLMVDPLNRDIYIISKREKNVHVYRLPYPQKVKKINRAKLVGTLPFHNVVAGDISATGCEILIKTYDTVYYWNRIPGRKLWQVLVKDKPQIIPYTPEPQGEAIAWHPNSLGFYTTSEEKGGTVAKLIFYKFD